MSEGKRKGALYGSLLRSHKRRFRIELQLRGGRGKDGKYSVAFWPILFKSREDAEKAIECLPVFSPMPQDKPDRKSKIKSVTVSTVYLSGKSLGGTS